MNTMNQLTVDAYCGNCGFTRSVVGEHGDRCTDCGRFTSDNPDVCCTTHEVRESPYPSGECPYCQQEREMRAQRRHEMTRNPQVEPW